MYIILCLMGNWLSLLAPMPIASGSLKPRNPKLIPILVQMAFFMVLPMTLAPMVLPLGIEFLIQYFAGIEGIPICLVLSLLECAAVLGIYRLFLGWQGEVLQSREQRILQIVTSKVE
jgi:ABC-2 type transport system permease protein